MEHKQKEYLPIKDYGIIGNLETAALVSKNGSIDWMCLPDFDSPSIFANILDAKRGGKFSISPIDGFTSEQKYIEKTNILETTFHVEGDKIFKIVDFMPPNVKNIHDSCVLVRKIEAVKGIIPLKLVFNPQFEYGLNKPSYKLIDDILIAQDPNNTLILKTDIALQHTDNHYISEFIINEGNTQWFIMYYLPYNKEIINTTDILPIGDASDRLKITQDYWESFSNRMTYDGPFKDEVLRSALITKMLIYNATGALIASPTTSLPESIAGKRNWDYRYAWLKDTAFAFHGLLNIGYKDEAYKIFNWLQTVCIQHGKNIPPVLGIRGESSLIELKLDHFEGYRHSKPVHIGNEAYSKFQLSSLAMLLRCALAAIEENIVPEMQMVDILLDYTEILANAWSNPDNSIWEVRDMQRQFVFSKVSALLGIKAGIEIAKKLRPDNNKIGEWEQKIDLINKQINDSGWNNDKKSFVFHYNTDSIDASLLLLPILGYLSITDNKIKSTIEEVRKELSVNSLLCRYKTDEYKDGINETEGAYLCASFWLAHCYGLMGKKDEAVSIIQNIINYSQPLKIFSEQISPSSKKERGNYPYSPAHISFINAVLSLKS